MSRACTVCTHHQREDIDREIASGASSVDLARSYELSRHALDRHRSPTTGHVSEAALVDAWRELRTADVRPLDLVTRLVDLSADAAAVRLRAAATGRDALVLRAIETERGLLGDLATRLGISSQSGLEELAEADAIVSAVLTLSTEDPGLSRRLLEVLRDQEAPAALLANVEAAATAIEQRQRLQLVPTHPQEGPR